MKAFVATLAFALAVNGQEIDRIVALVNNQPILESEWDQQERFEAMSNDVPFKAFQHSPEALDRLIDRRLILQQMESARIAMTDPKTAAAQITALRTQLDLTSDAAWKQKLKDYGLLEADVAAIVTEQNDLLLFIEARFRMAVHVNDDDIRRYYNETYLPEFRRSAKAGQPPKLAEVHDRIASVLTQQRMTELFNTWLKTLRAQANIRRFTKETKK